MRSIIKLIVDSMIVIESIFIRSKKGGQKKVLILRKDGLGDCIIFYATLRAYREHYRDAEIMLIFPRYFESLAPLLGKELVDKVIWFDHKAFSRDFEYRRRFMLDLKRTGYDVALYPVFTREKIGDLMMKMTHAKEIIGFDGARAAYTRIIRIPDDMKIELDRDIYFAEQVTGKKPRIDFPFFDVSKLPGREADELLQSAGIINSRFAVIFPGAGAPYRIWPADRFAKVAEYIASKGLVPVICGSTKEIPLAAEIISLMDPGTAKKTVNLSGKTDLAALAHILKRSKMYFGSDTGILHLAIAVGTPTAALMGSGGLWRFFPYGDASKNIAIFDQKYYENSTARTGDWDDADALRPGMVHPSISSITVDLARSGIDKLLPMIQ